jgi:hypothetical protein
MRKVLGPDHNRCFQLAAAPKLSFTETLALPSVGRLLTLYFLVFLAFNLFYVNIPVYAATGIQWSLAETGLFFSVLSFLMALVQGPVMTRAVRIWSDRALVLGGSLVLAISFPFFGSANTSNLYAGNALLALGNRLMWPLLLSILARATERNLQGGSTRACQQRGRGGQHNRFARGRIALQRSGYAGVCDLDGPQNVGTRVGLRDPTCGARLTVDAHGTSRPEHWEHLVAKTPITIQNP